ncbi:MAG: aspartate aminotransferase family protein, partial [Planctomycetia bacterium]|nr:aspartate aminotransferase family protein [Planctomycetia bacterium]
MAKEFPLTPAEVEPVATKYRRLSGIIPNPETVAELERLRAAEALSMRGQPPMIWDRAERVCGFGA